jgi:hypothetical protein
LPTAPPENLMQPLGPDDPTVAIRMEDTRQMPLPQLRAPSMAAPADARRIPPPAALAGIVAALLLAGASVGLATVAVRASDPLPPTETRGPAAGIVAPTTATTAPASVSSAPAPVVRPAPTATAARRPAPPRTRSATTRATRRQPTPTAPRTAPPRTAPPAADGTVTTAAQVAPTGTGSDPLRARPGT